MKTVRIVRGCVHVPTAAFSPSTFECAGLAVPSGNRDVRVVQRGETITLHDDAEADRLIARRVAIEVAANIDAHIDTGKSSFMAWMCRLMVTSLHASIEVK